MGHSVNGRNLVAMIGGWMIIKGIVNLVIGFSFENIITLLVSVGLAYLMLAKKPYMNYITAILLAAVVLAHIWGNIKSGAVLYIIEAIVDAVCVWQLVTNKDIKEHFGQN
ncbi:MAG: hypothetical protein J5994_06215 [Ruminococcus sp.]|nr:hypothetical protein [Ruminococcus sp.]